MGKRALAFLAITIFLAAVAAPLPANDDLDNYKCSLLWHGHSCLCMAAMDYKNGGFLYDIHISGPFLGFAIRVK